MPPPVPEELVELVVELLDAPPEPLDDVVLEVVVPAPPVLLELEEVVVVVAPPEPVVELKVDCASPEQPPAMLAEMDPPSRTRNTAGLRRCPTSERRIAPGYLDMRRADNGERWSLRHAPPGVEAREVVPSIPLAARGSPGK